MNTSKIKNYINNGKVVFDLTITNDEDANHKIVYKWVLNERWFRDPICAELKDDESGCERAFLFNSFDLDHTFHGVEGIKKEMTNLFKNDSRIHGMKIF